MSPRESTPIDFGIIGVAGYVAPRHLEAMRATGNSARVACDHSDSVGVLDRYGLTTEFTTDERAFADALRRLVRAHPIRRRYVAICTPNHLHFEHCRLVLEAGADAICEKPLVLAGSELDDLAALERRTGRRVYTVLQLRVHERLEELRRRMLASPRRTHDVELTYVVGRGPWYHASWKGDARRSGGVATNIGIHLFDLLLWLFGPVLSAKVHLGDAERMAGLFELERANVRWFVSVASADVPAKVADERTTQRAIIVDGETYEFSGGFAELHARVYASILAGDGLGIEAARPSVELTERLRSLEHAPIDVDAHPWCRGRERV